MTSFAIRRTLYMHSFSVFIIFNHRVNNTMCSAYWLVPIYLFIVEYIIPNCWIPLWAIYFQTFNCWFNAYTYRLHIWLPCILVHIDTHSHDNRGQCTFLRARTDSARSRHSQFLKRTENIADSRIMLVDIYLGYDVS